LDVITHVPLLLFLGYSAPESFRTKSSGTSLAGGDGFDFVEAIVIYRRPIVIGLLGSSAELQRDRDRLSFSPCGRADR